MLRVDKFIKATNIVKKRSIAQDMCENGVVSINGVMAKASKEVKIGDIIELKYLERIKKFKVLKIPVLKNVRKSEIQEYVSEI